MENNIFKSFIEDYNSAEMVVIGIGAQLHKKMYESESQLSDILEFYNEYLDKKNYFIITTHRDDLFKDSKYNRKRIVNPLMIKITDEETESEDSSSNVEIKQWELYNKWLSATLNHKLLIIELGEDFNNPNIFRWPFEKINHINQKSKMYRINDVFWQLPESISQRAESINMNALGFLVKLKKYCENCSQ